MPFQAQGAIVVTFAYRDQTGTRGYTRAHRAATDTLAAIKTAADALAVNLLAASGCSLLGYNVAAKYVNDTIVAAAAGSRVERKGVLSLATASGFKSEVTVPGIVAAAVNPAGGLVSTAAPVSDLIATLTGGGWTDNRGVALTRLDSDYETFTATSRKGRPTDISPEA